MSNTPVRLQKYLADQGVCSRRQGDKYIEAGKVQVNGEVAVLGQKVTSDDVIKLDDTVIKETQSYVYYKFNKPRGIVTTCKSHVDGEAIVDIINTPERVFPVGRLDKDTTGLILLTNDGRIAHRLMHPSFEHEKEYLVEVFGPIDDDQLDVLRSGTIRIYGSYVQPCEVIRRSSGTFTMILKEGKNRQIRKMVDSVGKHVKKLKRVRIEHIQLGKQDIGVLEPVSRGDVNTLLTRLDLPVHD